MPRSTAKKSRKKSTPRQFLRITKKNTDRLLVFTAKIHGHECRALIDSGADGSFIATHLVQKLKMKTVTKAVPDTVKLANGSEVSSSEVTYAPFCLGEFSDREPLHVLDLPDHDTGAALVEKSQPDH